MTGTVDDLIAAARKTIGTKEFPAGSNKQPFAIAVGHLDGRPWCQSLVGLLRGVPRDRKVS